MASDFSKGIFFVLAACFIWGLIFVIPQFMEGFSSIEIATAVISSMESFHFAYFLRIRTILFRPGKIPALFVDLCGWLLSLRYLRPPLCDTSHLRVIMESAYYIALYGT